MGKLLLIDGNAVLHRAFHAMPPFTTRRGEPIGAVHGFVNMILKAIADLKPTSIAVAFDEKEKTFRHIALPSYQAQRPPTAEDLSSQFGKARAFLDAAKIPAYSKPGFEADDVIGTIAEKSKEEVVIVTGDRDQLQLVNDRRNIKLYMPITGLTNAKLFGEKETEERMGVGASLIDDYKALVGDPSDNYSGVPGIGPKTAISLLTKYGSFENIYKNIKHIPQQTAQKLIRGEKAGRLSKKLATIVRDVPIDLNFEKMGKWKIDSPDVIKLFQEFGFKTLTERVKSAGRRIESEKQGELF
ncbi:MAG TPA: 5'-3' exonuclease H3TH domain-containing protein [Patescibacteria group bacterium]|nr:5'-3' exonuclease H3TH domain-containing protein [Patescibacteria group bacterium]